MKTQIYVVEWLNKHFSVRLANKSARSTQQDVDDTYRLLIDYLRPRAVEIFPKFDQEALEFLLKPGHFVPSVCYLAKFSLTSCITQTSFM